MFIEACFNTNNEYCLILSKLRVLIYVAFYNSFIILDNEDYIEYIKHYLSNKIEII